MPHPPPSVKPPPSALALSVRSMQSSPLSVLRSRCRRMRAAFTALVPAAAPLPQILIDFGPRAPSALLVLACLPSPSPRTHLYWYMHSPLQVVPVVMHPCTICSSRRAGTHALDLAPLAPYASHHPPYQSRSRSHTLYFCPLVRIIHPVIPRHADHPRPWYPFTEPAWILHLEPNSSEIMPPARFLLSFALGLAA
ncbi:hypothetical protein B0H13DRAFT_2332357 [Mycena leptocephala]|nr:hypothetical protein B0H13DRAFT_2332357 [Mycena leptocephala]